MRRLLGTVTGTFLLGLVAGACGDDATPSASPTPTPSASPTPSPSWSPSWLESAELPVGDRDVVGAWETGDLLGARLPAGASHGLPQVMYAVPDTADKEGRALVSLGLVKGDRIFRTIPALSPEDEEAPDGVDLYGGTFADGSFELVGAAPGRVAVSIEDPAGNVVPASAQSDEVLPGFTVFHHRGPWRPEWDATRLAPLVVVTDDGARVAVRERSWTG